jgi:hypothetical protein
MSYLMFWAVLLFLTIVVIAQAGPFINSSSNGTYTNPVLNLQGAADPSVDRIDRWPKG